MKNKGFSLIEIMIVIAIIAILVGVVLAFNGNFLGDAKEATLKTNLNTIRKALNSYYEDKRMYPTDLHSLTMGRAYLPTIPPDPYTEKVDYQLKYENYNEWVDYGTTPANSWGGIVDVRSSKMPDIGQ